MSDNNFKKSPITEAIKNEMIATNAWNETCPVALERLSLLTVSYIDFVGKTHHDGQIIVFDAAADNTLKIFKTLYENKFPINKISLLSNYSGDDELSMRENNSSSFNCRKIAGRDTFSLHAYGLALDINPLQNPYLDSEFTPLKKEVAVKPAEGMNYLNRSNVRPGMVESMLATPEKQTAAQLIKSNGFSIWGGEWNFPIDYHHFQVTRDQAEKMTKLPFEESHLYFQSLK